MANGVRNINTLQMDSLQVLADGTTYRNVLNIASLVPNAYDAIVATYPTDSSEVYTYKTGGVSGDTVATITVVYVDSSKEVLTSVVRS